ncbi:hypothetical protein [Xanthomonas nasturtii]|uniref:hypothetical protein n=1 Tax=Xanthomonas nasturtii TaxID=1843581 RepID=UPI002011C998|nr:hypothetical protein [Xanthomonas nasturtii]MCL1560205.1 hypothetical protein [Xanthomonas nasturtii]MCL1582137.1 hypothetical protein [Xanthomonas nasturtii]WVL52193.1 hypothetical protein M3O59_016795 [Xanthomonas nasturtii]
MSARIGPEGCTPAAGVVACAGRLAAQPADNSAAICIATGNSKCRHSNHQKNHGYFAISTMKKPKF